MLKLNDMEVDYEYLTTKFLFKNIQQNVSTSNHTIPSFNSIYKKKLTINESTDRKRNH